MTPKDGGPAFPRAGAQHKFQSGDSDFLEPVDGMSLRDYFAGRVLAVLVHDCPSDFWTVSEVVAEAYRYADAMLAAREKEPK